MPAKFLHKILNSINLIETLKLFIHSKKLSIVHLILNNGMNGKCNLLEILGDVNNVQEVLIIRGFLGNENPRITKPRITRAPKFESSGP